MRRPLLRHVSMTVVSLFFLGCAGAIPKNKGMEEVRSEVHDRIGASVESEHETDPSGPAPEIDSMLTPESAVQLALYRNPRVGMVFQDLGVARADVIDAIALDNPTVGGNVKWPHGESGYVLDLEVGQNIQKLIMMASRKKLANIQFEEAQLRAAQEVLNVAADTESAFYEAVAARHMARMNRLVVEATAVSADYARRQFEAGNLSDLELAREHAMFEEARVRLADSELEASRSLQELWRTMGLWNAGDADYEIPSQLPAIPDQEIPFKNLEPFAVENSLDLAVHRMQVETMAQALGISSDWRWLGTVDFGAAAERERDGTWLLGPSLNLEIPLFDRNQSELSRQEAQLRQRELELIDSAIGLRSNVRLYRELLYVNRKKARHYLDVVIPTRENIVALSQRQYNYMLIGVYELLNAKNDEYDAYGEYIVALRDYWVTRAELRRAAGGRLPSTETAMDDMKVSASDQERTMQ